MHEGNRAGTNAVRVGFLQRDAGRVCVERLQFGAVGLIAAADLYDLDGKLWRVAEAHALNFYEVPVHWSTLEVFNDLKARRYLVSGLDNKNAPPIFGETADPRGFSPNALSYYIR